MCFFRLSKYALMASWIFSRAFFLPTIGVCLRMIDPIRISNTFRMPALAYRFQIALPSQSSMAGTSMYDLTCRSCVLQDACSNHRLSRYNTGQEREHFAEGKRTSSRCLRLRPRYGGPTFATRLLPSCPPRASGSRVCAWFTSHSLGEGWSG